MKSTIERSGMRTVEISDLLTRVKALRLLWLERAGDKARKIRHLNDGVGEIERSIRMSGSSKPTFIAVSNAEIKMLERAVEELREIERTLENKLEWVRIRRRQLEIESPDGK